MRRSEWIGFGWIVLAIGFAACGGNEDRSTENLPATSLATLAENPAVTSAPTPAPTVEPRSTTAVPSIPVSGLFTEPEAEPAESPTLSPAVAETCPLDFGTTNFCANLVWITPASTGHGEFTLRFWRRGSGGEAAGAFAEPPFRLTIQPWMPEHHHGQLGPAVTVSSFGPGQYRVGNVFGGMHGSWVIRIQFFDAGGQLIVSQNSAPFNI